MSVIALAVGTPRTRATIITGILVAGIGFALYLGSAAWDCPRDCSPTQNASGPIWLVGLGLVLLADCWSLLSRLRRRRR